LLKPQTPDQRPVLDTLCATQAFYLRMVIIYESKTQKNESVSFLNQHKSVNWGKLSSRFIKKFSTSQSSLESQQCSRDIDYLESFHSSTQQQQQQQQNNNLQKGSGISIMWARLMSSMESSTRWNSSCAGSGLSGRLSESTNCEEESLYINMDSLVDAQHFEEDWAQHFEEDWEEHLLGAIELSEEDIEEIEEDDDDDDDNNFYLSDDDYSILGMDDFIVPKDPRFAINLTVDIEEFVVDPLYARYHTRRSYEYGQSDDDDYEDDDEEDITPNSVRRYSTSWMNEKIYESMEMSLEEGPDKMRGITLMLPAKTWSYESSYSVYESSVSDDFESYESDEIESIAEEQQPLSGDHDYNDNSSIELILKLDVLPCDRVQPLESSDQNKMNQVASTPVLSLDLQENDDPLVKEQESILSQSDDDYPIIPNDEEDRDMKTTTTMYMSHSRDILMRNTALNSGNSYIRKRTRHARHRSIVYQSQLKSSSQNTNLSYCSLKSSADMKPWKTIRWRDAI